MAVPVYILDEKGNKIKGYKSATDLAKGENIKVPSVVMVYTSLKGKIEKCKENHEVLKLRTNTKYLFIEEDYYKENKKIIKKLFSEKTIKIKNKEIYLYDIDKKDYIKTFFSMEEAIEYLGVSPTCVKSRVEKSTVFDGHFKLESNYIKKVYQYRQG